MKNKCILLRVVTTYLCVVAAIPVFAEDVRFEGRAFLRDSSALSYKIAREKAELSALEAVLDHLTKEAIPSEWPASIRAAAGRVFNSASLSSIHVRLTGWRVDPPRAEGQSIIVTGHVDSAVLNGLKMSQDAFEDALWSSSRSGKNAFDPAILIEIADERRNQEAHDHFIKYWSEICKSPSMAKSLRGLSLDDMPSLYRGYDEDVFASRLSSLSLPELMAAFSEGAYLPALCEEIAKRYETKGFIKTSNLMKKLDLYALLADKPNAGSVEAIASSVGNLQADVLSLGMIDSKWQSNSLVRLVYQSAGRIPVRKAACKSPSYDAGVSKFNCRPPQISDALQSFMESLNEDFSADQCNLIGRCMELSGNPAAASVWYRQAVICNASHPYALNNLKRLAQAKQAAEKECDENHKP